MKYSLIITVRNEEATIEPLLRSIAAQTQLPEEVIIADANSHDQTWKCITRFEGPFTITALGVGNVNRAVGRNKAIEQARQEIILITDAGCILHPSWAMEILRVFAVQNADVVAGYYEGQASTTFERCTIPYVLVMPDRINPTHFLPATRSMGIRKTAWAMLGGFDEQLRYAEDYAFARKLRAAGVRIAMAPQAIVTWQARHTWWQFVRMIYEHAYGDGYSQMWRPKVALIYVRYLFFLGLFLLGLLQSFVWVLLAMALLVYVAYAIKKNYRYVGQFAALIYLPILQLSSDLAVMLGTAFGLLTVLQ